MVDRKMEEDNNKTKTQNPMTFITSNDLVKEILKYLPAKSLDRFKSVSKYWRSVIQPTSKFLVVHQLPSKVEEDSNAITLLVETFSRDHDNNGQICRSLSRSCTISDYSIEESQSNSILVWGSCDGLVLISFYKFILDMRFYGFKYIYLINPKTMEQRTLSVASLQMAENQPGPMSSFPISVGFGKDIITGSYKVIVMYLYKDIASKTSVKITVLSLNSGEQRNAGVFPVFLRHICDEQTSVFVNGSLFWLTLPIETMSLPTPTRLVAMDLHTENFRLITLPSWYTKYSRGMRMWSLNDRLCLSDVLQSSDLDVWSLQQENPSEKWEKIYTFNISNIGWLNERFWTLGLAAAFFRNGRCRWAQDSLDHLRTTVYTPTLISPYRLVNDQCF